MSTVAMQTMSALDAGADRQAKLQSAAYEFVGLAMFGQMLRQARESCLNGELFHSSAEKTWQSQLDDVMVQQAAASADGMDPFGGLGKAVVRQLDKSGQSSEDPRRQSQPGRWTSPAPSADQLESRAGSVGRAGSLIDALGHQGLDLRG